MFLLLTAIMSQSFIDVDLFTNFFVVNLIDLELISLFAMCFFGSGLVVEVFLLALVLLTHLNVDSASTTTTTCGKFDALVVVVVVVVAFVVVVLCVGSTMTSESTLLID